MHNFRPATAYNITTSGTSAQGSAVSGTIRVLRLVATADCYVRVGADPTAVAGDTLIVANFPQFILVAPGEKIAAIQRAAGGLLNVTECASA